MSRLLVLLSLSGTLTLLAFLVCFKISEIFFFDKVFFNRSIIHGYLHQKDLNHLEIFGKRSLGVRWINAWDTNTFHLPKELSPQNPKRPFLIVVIGDSFVWGQGIRNSQTFWDKLEKKLNSIRPTKVVSFGYSGDSIFDNYRKYKKIKGMNLSPDLYIFGFVDNDILLYQYQLEVILSEEDVFFKNCSGELIVQNSELNYEENKKLSLNESSKNYCAFMNLAKKLPKDKALYFDFWPPQLQTVSPEQSAIETFKKEQLLVIDPAKEILDHFQKGNLNINSISSLHVSQTDSHPSDLANTLFSDSIFKELMRNQKLNFNEKI